ncbi:MAG: tetratricopeptide repeat protein [Chloroflexota bacterium]
MTTSLPSETITLLFTDIEGSTRLLEADPRAYHSALARHDALLRQAVSTHNGAVFKDTGDGLCAAFTNASDALSAALAAQLAIQAEPWGTHQPVRVRMAIHTGDVQLQGHEYFGLPLHRCARLMDSAHGGQLVLSESAAALLADVLPPDAALTDLGEHRLRDIARPERVFQLIHPALPRDFPPFRALLDIPTNLPPQATAFIGRHHQISAARELILRPDTRILTLTGPGGTGKTRLGLQVATDLLEAFPDGVFFVPLSSIVDPALVIPTIGLTLNVRESPGRGMLAALIDLLERKRLLLLLDNLEQVLDAAPEISQLVASTTALQILVTSRAPLRLYGERQYPVPPLVLPDLRTSPSAAHLAQFESVTLFVDRAQAALPDFTLTDDNAADIAEICRRLDGLPLAIELAAARIRTLPPRAMLQRLEHRLPLLTGGARDLPARQRTLRDAIIWSYDLLEPGEQILFRRLAVFRGFSLESAESVCAGEPPRPGATSVAALPLPISVLDGIESLVDKSLLRQEQTPEGEAWYSMLETVRELAVELLATSDEAPALHRRQILAAMKLAEAAEPELFRSPQHQWFVRIQRELDNLRAALDWSEEHGYVEPALRLAVALWWHWSVSGHAEEGRVRIERLLTRFPMKPGGGRAELYGRLQYGAGMLALVQGDHDAARRFQDASLALRRTSPDRVGLISALEGAGAVACVQGDYDAAHGYLNEALAIAHSLEDPVQIALVLHALGNVVSEQGELARARDLYLEAIQLLPERVGMHGHWISLATNALERGSYEEAERVVLAAQSKRGSQGNHHIDAFAAATLGAIDLARSNLVTAHQRLCDSITICVSFGDFTVAAQVLERFVALAMALHRRAVAIRIAGAADSLRGRYGALRSRSAQAALDRLLEPARLELGDETFNRIFRDGNTLDPAQAVHVAIAATAPNPPTGDSGAQPGRTAGDRTSAPLTRREQEVAVLIARGLTNRQIADALVITEGTAANHVVHILNKLGFSSRAQVASWATANGLAATPPSI